MLQKLNVSENEYFGGNASEVESLDEKLLKCVRNGEFDLADALIREGANIAGAGNGCPLIHVAAANNHVRMVRLLIEAGADVNEKSPGSGDSALHCAADANSVEIASMLLERGADVDARNAFGSSPILRAAAARSDSSDLTALLLDRGAAAGAADADGVTALHRAASSDSVATAMLLIERGADARARAKNGATPLHAAAEKNSARTAKLLIRAGADVNAREAVFGETPLHAAARRNATEAAWLLIDAGADVNAAWGDGVTPLHAAAVADAGDCARLLIEKGADVNATGVDGLTPFFYASARAKSETAGLIAAAGGRSHNPKAFLLNRECEPLAAKAAELAGRLTALRRALKKEYGAFLAGSNKASGFQYFDSCAKAAGEISSACEGLVLPQTPSSVTAAKCLRELDRYRGAIRDASFILSKKSAFLSRLAKGGLSAAERDAAYAEASEGEQEALDACWKSGKRLEAIIELAKKAAITR